MENVRSGFSLRTSKRREATQRIADRVMPCPGRPLPLDRGQQLCDQYRYAGNHDAEHHGHFHAGLDAMIGLEGGHPPDDHPLDHIDRCQILAAEIDESEVSSQPSGDQMDQRKLNDYDQGILYMKWKKVWP